MTEKKEAVFIWRRKTKDRPGRFAVVRLSKGGKYGDELAYIEADRDKTGLQELERIAKELTSKVPDEYKVILPMGIDI